jgi:hypothetical protein
VLRVGRQCNKTHGQVDGNLTAIVGNLKLLFRVVWLLYLVWCVGSVCEAASPPMVAGASKLWGYVMYFARTCMFQFLVVCWDLSVGQSITSTTN